MTASRWLPKARLQALVDTLLARGFEVIGPTIDQGAIVYRALTSVDELPRGWTDRQEAGTYRLERRNDDRCFGFVVGPQSWKQFLFPASATVLRSHREGDGWSYEAPVEVPPRYAFLGVRACELAAIAVQDRVFLSGGYVDPVYEARRRNAFLVAVNCTQAAPTCFCTSMDTGPRCTAGYDLALTETDEGFEIESGSPRGDEILSELDLREATPSELEAAETQRQHAPEQIQRYLDTRDLRDRLQGALNHPHWEIVAQRCLSCSNCTMVCPTCFCSSVEEVADLSGEHVERRRVWDSCFNLDFSYMNGGIVRNSIASRYRQWLTHKLATWHDQFDTSGCVGCGRCITWCPVGIDLTVEVPALTQPPSTTMSTDHVP